MWDTSARLLRLLSLLQTPRDWTGADLAERLEVDVRTVRRDIDKLRALGYPVDATRGTAGYRLGAGAKLPPLLLDDDEAIAVAIGLRTAASGTVAGIEESSLRALAKLDQVLPSRLRHRVNLLHAVTVTVPGRGPSVDPDVLTTVARACHDHQELRFDYQSRDAEPSVRHVRPHRLVHTAHRWYLVAWDVERDDWRTYRVDRLRPRIPTGPRFTPGPPPDDDLVRYLSRGCRPRRTGTRLGSCCMSPPRSRWSGSRRPWGLSRRSTGRRASCTPARTRSTRSLSTSDCSASRSTWSNHPSW
ncbi:hypothetical protein GCM10029964_070780 [Kibdelosporangium lantanae]